MISLANGHIALTMNPDFGARITSLTDLASGRQWLVPGECVDGAAYLGDQARGWDECFPTVGACDHPAWGGQLRDHGLLWGRNWDSSFGHDTCTATFDHAQFGFSRTLRLEGSTLIADYYVRNKTLHPLPYLWSQHTLLATTPTDRIALNGIVDMQAQSQSLGWPDHLGRDLSAVGDLSQGFALKAYASTPGAASAEIIGPDNGIRFDWVGTSVPAFGLWLDYGGWPALAPVHQVALEPTTAPTDDLAQACAMGSARMLAFGVTHRWTVRITVTAPTSRGRT